MYNAKCVVDRAEDKSNTRKQIQTNFKFSCFLFIMLERFVYARRKRIPTFSKTLIYVSQFRKTLNSNCWKEVV